MKNIVALDSRYVPMTQQKHCCVPTCFLMLMYKLGLPLIPQELLGYELGLVVSPENKDFFWNPRLGEMPPAGYGTRINLPEYEPNAVFERLGIPLEMHKHAINDFNSSVEIINFLEAVEKGDRDVMVSFNHGVLTGRKHSSGHFCVFDQIKLNDKKVRLIDPSSLEPKWNIVDVERLIEAMKKHPAKRGAFWEIIKK